MSHNDNVPVLKVTIIYEGDRVDVDDAIYGTRDRANVLRSELFDATETIERLEKDIHGLNERMHARDAQNALLSDELDRAYTSKNGLEEALTRSENRECQLVRLEKDTRLKLQGEIHSRDNTIARQREALLALGAGSVNLEEFAAFLATRPRPDFDVNRPKAVDANVSPRESDGDYPFGLLQGTREQVKEQVLACYVNDPERREKIQAIKVMRQRSGLGLRESKDLVEWAIGQYYTDR